MPLLRSLQVWNDPVARSAAVNMAVDELLLRQLGSVPLIRFYQWSEPSMSFGYFDTFDSAREKFPCDELSVVRRWTGGGVVDHRVDVTYTLLLPRGHEWAQLRGAGSYRIVHAAVAEMLQDQGIRAKLIETDSEGSSVACFERPVMYDVVDEKGSKLAGAGQRRTRWGVLHQGSVQAVDYDSAWKDDLAGRLSEELEHVDMPDMDQKELDELAAKYASDKWLFKR